jgi:methylated-DNA-[protein]-cysteine S-methyltransferase
MRVQSSLHLRIDRFPTPVGEALLVTDALGQLRALDFSDYEDRMLRLLRRHYGSATLQNGPAPVPIRSALDAYFSGRLHALATITCATGGTQFQRTVWDALTTIPPGQTLSYAALARRIGRPKAVRAVGLANGANPLGIVVPCHRVIGSDGSLTGYGGGLPRKRWLLEHEGAGCRATPAAAFWRA